jgi:hypothetical protein
MDSNHQYRSQKPAISEAFPISQGLAAEFKTIGAEIAAQISAVTKSIISLRGLAPSRPTSLLPEHKPATANAGP